MYKQGMLYKFPQLYEGNFHKEAKEILYDLIKNNTPMKDNYGNIVSIDMTHKNSFLQIESPTMLGCGGNVLYGNTSNLCTNSAVGWKYKPYCKFEYEYGFIEEVPCWKCRDINYYNATKEFIGFIADISYGYENNHKIWFEIKHSNAISPKKYSFCKSNNIQMYEIDSIDISNDLDCIHLIKIDDAYCANNMRDNRVDNILNKSMEEIEIEGFIQSAKVKEYLTNLGDGYQKIFFDVFIDENELLEFVIKTGKKAKEIATRYNIPSGRILTTSDGFMNMRRNIMEFEDAIRFIRKPK